jgi:hypothetical protein
MGAFSAKNGVLNFNFFGGMTANNFMRIDGQV